MAIKINTLSAHALFMHIHLLGTNGWFDTETGQTPCILIDSQEEYVILDAGNGIRKMDSYITDTKKPILLLLSHFHIDHSAGLHILPKFAFPQGMTILGQPGTKRTLSRLVKSPFMAPLELFRKDMQVDVRDLRIGKNRFGPLNIETLPLIHKDPCFGFSFSLEGKKIAYCTDTGVCENLAKLAKNADLLISECSWRVRNQIPDWPHLAPEDAADIAKKAGAKKLILTHFDAVQYPKRSDRIEAQKKARKIFPNTFAGEDDMEIEL